MIEQAGAVVLLDRNRALHRASQFLGALPAGFFSLVGLGALFIAGWDVVEGRLNENTAVLCLVGLGVTYLSVSSMRNGMRGAFGAVREVSGVLEHAAEVQHFTGRIPQLFWHLVVEGREFQIFAHDLTHESLLAPGRRVTVQIAGDGEVLQLSADGSSAVSPLELPPSPPPGLLSADDLLRARQALQRTALRAFALAAAGVGLGWWFRESAPGLIFAAICSLAFLAAGLGLLQAVTRLEIVNPGTASEVLEGRYRRMLGGAGLEYVDSMRLTVAAPIRPHPLAQKVRVRGITVQTPWAATSSTFVVVEWLATTA